MNATWCNHQIVVTLTPDTCCWNLVIKNNLTEDIHHQTSCKPLWKRLVWSLQGSKKNNTAQTKVSFLMCLDLSASSLSCSPLRAALGTEAVPFHSELGLVWDWLGWLGSLFEWKMIPFNLYSFGAYFPNILGWDWLGWFWIFIWIKDPSSLYSCGAYFPNILGWDWLKDPSSL